jgi:2'-5' RNA ligase
MENKAAKDVVVKAQIASPDNELIFDKIAKLAPLRYAYKPKRYHVTVGYIKDVNLDHIERLLEFFNERLSAITTEVSSVEFIINDAQAFYNKITLTPKNSESFKRLNSIAQQILENFNEQEACNYFFDKHTLNDYYIPHMTIGEGGSDAIKYLQEFLKSNQINLKAKISHIIAKVMT